MVGICPMSNPIRDYAWGSRSVLAELLGEPVPSEQPQAELWIGAHPGDPSRVRRGERWISLTELLSADPDGVLGGAVASRFDGELPFLLKVIAAERPLSMQAHPDAGQAREGFSRENEAGIAPPERNYHDPRPKPELVCALTPFWALCGFRSAHEIAENFRSLQVETFATEVERLERDSESSGLERFFEALTSAGNQRVSRAASEAVAAAASDDSEPMRSWVGKLAAQYPDDVSVLSPLFLNLVLLSPGEALFLGPGVLHSYLRGSAIEIMGNSDNVLRGGLTTKHVDLNELRRVLRFESTFPHSLRPRALGQGERVFETPAEEFELAVLSVEEGASWASAHARGVEIVLVVEGQLQLTDRGTDESLVLERGGSALIPASVESYELSGAGVAYRAGVPGASAGGA